jgi:hypothetical protein
VIELQSEGSSAEIQKAVDIEKNNVVEEKIQKLVVILFPELVGQKDDSQSKYDQEKIDQDDGGAHSLFLTRHRGNVNS